MSIDPHITKKDMYDKICTLLADYENPRDARFYGKTVTEEDLYDMLVFIVEHWEII